MAVLLLVIPIGQLTFESQRYSVELLIAGLAVPCIVATGMWSSLLQSGGHVGRLARTQAISSFLGLLAGLPFIILFGIDCSPTILVCYRKGIIFVPVRSSLQSIVCGFLELLWGGDVLYIYRVAVSGKMGLYAPCCEWTALL